MAYKITIPKHGARAGEITIESLDSTSCSTIQEISQHYGPITSNVHINHGDDQPVYDSVHIAQ